jgi:hypothetical protein
VEVSDRRGGNMTSLDNLMSSCNWNSISLSIDNVTLNVDDAYRDLLNVLHNVLDNLLGYKMITIRNSEHCFLTPEVKILLRKRNKLLHSGCLNKAEALTCKISRLIIKIKTRWLSKTDHRNIRQLWQAVQSSSYMKTESRSCVPSNLRASSAVSELFAFKKSQKPVKNSLKSRPLKLSTPQWAGR